MPQRIVIALLDLSPAEGIYGNLVFIQNSSVAFANPMMRIRALVGLSFRGPPCRGQMEGSVSVLFCLPPAADHPSGRPWKPL